MNRHLSQNDATEFEDATPQSLETWPGEQFAPPGPSGPRRSLQYHHAVRPFPQHHVWSGTGAHAEGETSRRSRNPGPNISPEDTWQRIPPMVTGSQWCRHRLDSTISRYSAESLYRLAVGASLYIVIAGYTNPRGNQVIDFFLNRAQIQLQMYASGLKDGIFANDEARAAFYTFSQQQSNIIQVRRMALNPIFSNLLQEELLLILYKSSKLGDSLCTRMINIPWENFFNMED